MTEIGFLGTGGWIATKKRDNTSLLIRHENKITLIDCPGSVIQKIKLFEFEPADIVSVFVTHVHPDHIYGLPSLIHSLMLEECAINLFGSESAVDFCRQLLDLFQLLEKRIKCRVNFVSLASGQRFSPQPSVSCSCLSVPHHPSSLAYVFNFEKESKTMMYSGDTPIFPPLFLEARKVDWLIHECSAPKRYFDRYPVLYDIHTNAYDLGAESRKAQVKKLIPCHLFGDLDFVESEIEEELLENYGGEVIIPHDSMKIAI